MSKQISATIKIIALAIVLSFGVSYVYAWVAPTVAPTGGNKAEPINVSATAQTKSGGLTVGSITAPSHCIGASCITSWPAGGGSTPPVGSTFLDTSTTAQTKSGGLTVGSITAPSHCIGASCITSWPAGGGGSGTLTSLSAGTGITLSPNPITTTGTISANTSVVQSRVTGTCPTGSSINAVASGGTVTCEIDDGVFGMGNTNYIPRWISGIQIGNSAILQDASNNISIAGQNINMANSTNSKFYGDGMYTAARQTGAFVVQDPAGSGYKPVYASDYYISATNKWASTAQTRVSGTCAVGQAITAISADGTVTCGAAGGGTPSIGIYSCPVKYNTSPAAWATFGCVGQISSTPTCSNYSSNGVFTTFNCTYLGTLRIN